MGNRPGLDPSQWEEDSFSLMKENQVPVGNTNFSFKGEANVGSHTPAPLEGPFGEREGKTVRDSVNDKWMGEERAKLRGRRPGGERTGRPTEEAAEGRGEGGMKRKEKAGKTGPRLCRLAHRLPVL